MKISTPLPVEFLSVDSITILVASTCLTTPFDVAVIVAFESLATTASTPVPTRGAEDVNNGTACRCMFDPINARFASSFSKNGIRPVATETNCFGETSIKSISSPLTSS